jgi:dsDNA-specific endonuclease/ATPase MutS2
MHVNALKALEFDRIRAALAREAATPLGRARAEVLEPATDPDQVAEALALTSEAARSRSMRATTCRRRSPRSRWRISRSIRRGS